MHPTHTTHDSRTPARRRRTLLPNQLRSSLIAILTLIVALGLGGCSSDDPARPEASAPVTLEGSDDITWNTLDEALSQAPDGATLRLAARTYELGAPISRDRVTLVGTQGTILLSRSSSSSDDAQLVIRDAEDLVIEGVRFDDGPRGGILVRNSSGIVLRDVGASGNADYGLRVRASSDVTVEGGEVSGNVGRGIEVRDGSSDVSVSGATVERNEDGGLRVRESSMVSITGSLVSANGDDGILVRESTGVSITDNVITDNAEYGLRVEESEVSRSGNTFEGNGQREDDGDGDDGAGDDDGDPGFGGPAEFEGIATLMSVEGTLGSRVARIELHHVTTTTTIEVNETATSFEPLGDLIDFDAMLTTLEAGIRTVDVEGEGTGRQNGVIEASNVKVETDEDR